MDTVIRIRLVFVPVALILALFFSAKAIGAEETAQKILVIHSYHEEYPWVQGINEGIKRAFAGRQDLVVQTHYMDTKRHTSQDFKVQAGRAARERIASWKPDAVIACDDNAQIFVTQQYVGKAPYFVFCGVNADPAIYGFPASNVTGILERPQYKASIELLKSIVPHIKKIAVIGDDDPTSVASLAYMQLDPPADIQIVGYHIIGDFDLWQKRIREYNREVDAVAIYMYHTVRRQTEEVSMPPQEVMAWTIANCDIPTAGMFDFAVEDGMLCGVVASAQEHGFEAAQMAGELLAGKDIKDLPIKRADIGIKMINLNTARKLRLIVPKEILDNMEKVIE